MAQGFAPTPPVAKPIEARVPWYTVKPDLSNVSNRKMLPTLTPAQRSALTRYGFVARPTAEEQLFYVYENNAYKKIGSFVTTDSVLHTYHIFYDFSLRNLEKTRLVPAVRELSARMLKANLTALAEKRTPAVREALRKNVVFFAVPLTLLGTRPNIPADLRPLLEGEISRIMAHKERDYCITGAKIDYSQFVPRGHYTREKVFEQYFRAMMWYGLTPMPLEKEHVLDIPPTIEALIITEQLQQDSAARALWQQVYDPTVFYVGSADDLSFYDYGKLIPPVFGQGSLDRFADPAKLAQFYDAAKKELRGPGIENFTGDEGLQGKQFRFMGQRFIPDSRMLQELTYPKVGTSTKRRLFPMGLDVFAVLGNAHAAQLLDETYRQPQYANYLSQRKKLQDEIAALTPAEWMQNLYYGWMYCLLPLQQPRPEGYPAFMRNVAWQEKSLLTSLGSWTELRHDTILYAKQSVAECGEGGDEPPPVMGYVEPEVLVYERLGQLLRLNKAGLLQRHLLTSEDELAYDFDAFIELTDFLATASRKELRNEALSRDELRALEHYGGTLERLMLSIASLGQQGAIHNWWEIESKTDRSMALIADVHTSMPNVLEEGVGNAAEMWVVVPVQGKLYLTRGAIFTYYEFQHPARDRMTDEAWQGRVRKGAAPPMPGWVHRFLLGPGPQKPSAPEELEMEGYQTGC
jgi:hypothetical protein